MNFIKKLSLWFLFVNLVYSPFHDIQADYFSSLKLDVIVWENYIPTASVVLIVGMLVYSLSGPDDLSVELRIALLKSEILEYQKQRAREQKCLDEFKQSIKIYSPKINNVRTNTGLQKFANQTYHSVIQIHEKHLKYCSLKCMEFFLDQVEQIAPCIIYIEKDIKVTDPFALRLNYFGSNTNTRPSDNCIKQFINQINVLQQTNNSVLILGIAKNKYFNACANDISNIGFNIEHENLGYRERIEFLDLLLKTKKYFDFSLQYVAKKTIGFNYQQLIDIIHEAELFAVQDRNKTIDSSHIDKAYNAITKSCDICKIEQQELRVTSIHEMGHAMVAVHFNKNFTLHNVSIIPQYEFYKSSWYGDEIEKSLYLGITSVTQECWAKEKIRVDKEFIIICLAGKIAEQLFFGLPNGILLNHANGFKDFIDNPGGARVDLNKARDTARDVIRDMKNQNYNTSKYDNIDNLIDELYEEALTFVRFYKNKIEQGAKILEQEEFMLGSQIYNLLKT